jgi:hypothetical protein
LFFDEKIIKNVSSFWSKSSNDVNRRAVLSCFPDLWLSFKQLLKAVID